MRPLPALFLISYEYVSNTLYSLCLTGDFVTQSASSHMCSNVWIQWNPQPTFGFACSFREVDSVVWREVKLELEVEWWRGEERSTAHSRKTPAKSSETHEAAESERLGDVDLTLVPRGFSFRSQAGACVSEFET